MTDTSSPVPPRARFTGLDGLRALAVVLVVAYHLFPGWIMRSGFVGVDVFFVISGFLITSLLLRERARTGGIALGDFWRRRARRLIPALALLVTVTATWAWLLGGDVLVRLGWQVLGAATFSYNWVSVANGSDYFSAATPELYRNLWSLAVEEQFYGVWPLLLPLLLLIPRAWVRAMVALLAAAASAAWMAEAVASGGSLTRAYFGTDTHAFGLLLGVALAVGLQRLFTDPPAWVLSRTAIVSGALAGGAAVVGLFALTLLGESPDVLTFPGTLLAASVLAAVAIVCGAAPGSRLGPLLDVAPVRWIGDRSYGIYLWHWPLLVLMAAMSGMNAGSDILPVWLGMAALALTIAFAALSYRFVEQPIRRHGFRGSLRLMKARLTGPPAARFRVAAVLALGVVVVGGTTAAIADAPDESSAQAAVQAGERALEATTSPRPPLLPEGTADAGTPSTPVVDGSQIVAVGDSVMLASAPALMERYPGIRIDAKVSRSMWAAPGIVQRLADRHQLRRYVVLGLGTNGAVDTGSLDRVAQAVGPQRQIVLVTAHAPRSWIDGVNRSLRSYADSHSNVIVADWAGAIRGHADLLAGDEIHPGAAGGRLYAGAIADAISAAQERHAQERELMLLRVAALTS